MANWWEDEETFDSGSDANQPQEDSNWWEQDTVEIEASDSGDWWETEAEVEPVENVSEIQTEEPVIDEVVDEVQEDDQNWWETEEGPGEATTDKGVGTYLGEIASDTGTFLKESAGWGAAAGYSAASAGMGALMKGYSFMMPEGHLGKDPIKAQGELMRQFWTDKGKEFINPKY